MTKSTDVAFFDKLKELRSEFDRLIEAHSELNILTNKELLVFEKMLSDKTLSEIAMGLNLSSSTVHYHSKNIYRKLGVRSRTQLLVEYKNLF